MEHRAKNLSLEVVGAMQSKALGKLWSEVRDACNRADRPRSLWGAKDERDACYYSLRRIEAAALLVLLGRKALDRFSMRDVTPPVLEYFSYADSHPMIDEQPRELLEFFLAAKQSFPELENNIDDLLIDIAEQNPGLARHNFQDDPLWLKEFYSFAKGLRHRSQVYVLGKAIPHHQLTDKMKDLYYDELSALISALAGEIERNAKWDRGLMRPKLAAVLDNAAGHLKRAAEDLDQAWDICEPYVDLTRKKMAMEHVFDREHISNCDVSRWVHSYMLSLRMQGESGREVSYLSPLEGVDYQQRLQQDGLFEQRITALIPALSLWTGLEEWELECEVNRLIGRDLYHFESSDKPQTERTLWQKVWSCLKGNQAEPLSEKLSSVTPPVFLVADREQGKPNDSALLFERQLLAFIERVGWLTALKAGSGMNSHFWRGICPQRGSPVEISIVADRYNTVCRLQPGTAWLVRIQEDDDLVFCQRLSRYWQKKLQPSQGAGSAALPVCV